MKRRYVIDVTAYDHVSTTFIEADSEEEALALAAAKYDISLVVRAVYPKEER